jgi:hypothetical protein
MRVMSKVEAGFRQNGQPILKEGMNVLEEPLTLIEREFITAMLGAQLIEIVSKEVAPAASSEHESRADDETISMPAAPSSETKLTVAAKAKKPKRMRMRRAGAK